MGINAQTNDSYSVGLQMGREGDVLTYLEEDEVMAKVRRLGGSSAKGAWPRLLLLQH